MYLKFKQDASKNSYKNASFQHFSINLIKKCAFSHSQQHIKNEKMKK